MLFKCPLCFKRHWTKGSRDNCQKRHHRISLQSQTGNSFGRAPDLPPIAYTPEPRTETTSDSPMNTLGNVAVGYMAGDMISDLAKAFEDKAEEAPKVEVQAPAPKETTEWSQPQEDTSYRSAPTPTVEDTSSSGGYSSLDSFSSLDSSSSDSWSSSSDW